MKDNIIEVDEQKLTKYLEGDIGKKLFEVRKSLKSFMENRELLQVVVYISELGIPAHLVILLILVCIFSRDGIVMEDQVY